MYDVLEISYIKSLYTLNEGGKKEGIIKEYMKKNIDEKLRKKLEKKLKKISRAKKEAEKLIYEYKIS